MYSPAVHQSAGQQNGPSAISQPSVAEAAEYCARRLAGLATGPVPNRGPAAAAVIWALVGMSTVFLALRIYCKIWRSRGLWWDDLVLIISWVRPLF